MDFLNEQKLIYTSKKNENIYKYFNEKYDIHYPELFLLCAVLGFKKKRREQFSEKGREMRSNYFKNAKRVSLYSILLDRESNFEIQDFDNKDKIPLLIKVLQEYAEGGVEILIENVFRSKYNHRNLDETYEWYMLDVLNYVKTIADEE